MSRLPETGPSLLRRIRQQERAQARQVNASPFSRSGSGVTGEDELTVEGLLRIIGQMVVDGTLVVNGPTTLAGALGITGDTTIAGALGITGDTEVGGTLTSADFDGNLAAGDAGTTGWAMNASRVAIGELILRPGSVGNDALANPITTASDSSSTAGLGFPSSEAAVYTGSPITVPAGYTSALVMVIATGRCYNDAASSIYFGLRPRIDASTGAWATGATMQTLLAPGAQGTVSSPEVYTFDFDGEAGNSLTMSVLAWTTVPIGATAGNFAGFSWIVLFSR